MLRYHFDKEERIPSPALVYYRDMIEENTRKAIEIAGDPGRMWPHVKTHKMAELIKMQLSMGIRRFKCATASEVRMTAGAGAGHIIWAYPIVGPNVEIFTALVKEFQDCSICCLADDLKALAELDRGAKKAGITAGVMLDINMGMDRTGLEPERIAEFLSAAEGLENIRICGLHCYDGHIHDHELSERKGTAREASERLFAVLDELAEKGIRFENIVMGGTPTFPCHAEREGVFLSPGTIFVSDYGYCKNFPDLHVLPAAAVLTRVISHPGEDLFTLDTGYKAISADPDPRGVIAELYGKCEAILSSEEHWVFRMKPEFRHLRPAVGTLLHAIPTHICPTTALYDAAYVVSGGKLEGIWKVSARERMDATLPEDLL